jgi:hypothetical protein
MRRVAALVLCAATLVSACTTAGAKGAARSLPELADRTSRLARQFTHRVRIVGHELVITGFVEDSYRYRASVAVDGTPAYEEVVADDARYVRVLSPSLVAIGADPATLAAVHPAYAAALGGGWVVDPKGAAPEFRTGSKPPPVPLNPDLVLDSIQALDVVPRIVEHGTQEYNKDAVTYLPKNDKFATITVPGTRRYDVLPAAYDSNAVVVHMNEVRVHFQWTALWVTDDAFARLESRVELPDPANPTYREVYRQIGQAGSASLHSMLAAGASGRLLTDSYLLEPRAGSVAIPANAATEDLAPAFRAATQSFGALAQQVGPLTARPT